MKLIYLALFTFVTFLCEAQSFKTDHFSQLKFRFIGPDGNRAIAVVGEPGNPAVSYLGAASGGIWKTEDAGVNWKPVFDDTDDSSIGALAIAPSDHKQVWAGTGETFLIRPAHAVGNGVYKSSDAGKTWKKMGLDKSFRISRIIVHPTDTNVVYVGVLGHTHGPQQEKGVYKTMDSGKTWEKVLFVNENTGVSDMAIDPKNPNTVYAAMWQVEIKTWNLKSGGPGSGIYRSKDGGKTWTPLRNGLESGPSHPVGKTSVDVAYSNPKVLYALVEDKEPRLYRSENGGDSWKLMQQDHSMAQRAAYYTRVRVSTQDENRVYTINVSMKMSKDGGKSWSDQLGPWDAGGDNHDMWFDPTDASRIMVAHDGCLNMSFNYGKSWENINLPVAQMYNISVDTRVPYYVYGNRQDAWSYRGPSRYLGGWNIPLGVWHGVGGCESGDAKVDPFDNNIVWSQCYDGGLDVFDLTTMQMRDVRVWPEAGYGYAPADLKYRWHWNFPVVLSKHTKGKGWAGSQYVHETTNAGQSWKVISLDLTRNDKTHQQSSGGMAGDNLMTFDGSTLFTMAESPVQEGVLWTGSNDGLLHVTRDGGRSWFKASDFMPDLPKWGTVRSIEPSNFDASTCYVSVDAHQDGDFSAYVYKTTDMGKTWKRLAVNIPSSNSNFVHQIKEDPEKQGLLWIGTDNGLYFSPDDGANWIRFRHGLPPAPVFGIAIQKQFNDLVIGTYGRGIYILDDITPIREFTNEVQNSNEFLFTPGTAYRFQKVDGIKYKSSHSDGNNPPYGVSINYFLKEAAKDISVSILDAKGTLVKSLEAKGEAGINRIVWDLRHQEYDFPPLRTKPKDKEWVTLDKEGKRPMFIYDLDIGPGMSPTLVPPGQYTAVLRVNGKELRKNIQVLKDPNTKSTLSDIQQQYEFGMKIYTSVSKCLALIDEMEQSRAKLLNNTKDLKVAKMALPLEKKIYDIESRIFDVHQTGARQDIFRNPAKVLERLLAIAKEGQTASADFPPTDQQQEVYALLSNRLQEINRDWESLKKSLEWKKNGLSQ
ncbi:MAG TPA: glycosyl hydrolase [Cytophagales bacterium]|nr:glycosyl hydrolase [Cytophagales bacterium]